MTSRRAFVSMLAGGAYAASRPLSAAEPPKRVGAFTFMDDEDYKDPAQVQAFIKEAYEEPLAQFGWRNGENVKVAPHFILMMSDWKVAIPTVAREVAAAKYDGVFVEGEVLTRALQQAAPALPIAAYLFDPVGQGFAQSYAKPGGMVTGAHRGSREVYLKQIDLLRRIVPGMSRIAWIGFEPQLEMGWRAFEWAAKEAGVAVRQVILKVANGAFAGLAEDFQAMRRDGYTCAQFNGAIELDIKAVTDLALRHRIALSFTGSPQDLGREGLLLQYRSLRKGMEVKLASTMSKILAGQRPGDIPFEGPTAYSLRINLKTADRLGLKVPNDMLLMANEVLR